MSEFDRFVQEGRDCFLVRYVSRVTGLTYYADLVLDDVEKLAAKYAAEQAEKPESEEDRACVLLSVRQTLDGYGLASDDPHDTANDIGIWWFYEYLDGRGEEHIVSDWRRYVKPARPAWPAWPRGVVRGPKGRRT